MGNFNIFDFFNAVNNNPAAKNALEKIFAGNKPSANVNNAAARGKERLKPNETAAPNRAETAGVNRKNDGGAPKIESAAPAKPMRYSDGSLAEIIKRHEALSKKIDEQNGNREQKLLTEKEKTPLSFPPDKI